MSTANEAYREHDTIPPHIRHEGRHGVTPPDGIKWSGPSDVPPVGALIRLRINRIGPARVTRYAVHHGWLGVMAQPLAPPAWWLRQGNKLGSSALAFGAEIDHPFADRLVAVRISPTIANEYASRIPDDIPEEAYLTGIRHVRLTSACAMLADAEFNGDSKNGPSEMPLPIGNAYRALAKQLRIVIDRTRE